MLLILWGWDCVKAIYNITPAREHIYSSLKAKYAETDRVHNNRNPSLVCNMQKKMQILTNAEFHAHFHKLYILCPLPVFVYPAHIKILHMHSLYHFYPTYTFLSLGTWVSRSFFTRSSLIFSSTLISSFCALASTSPTSTPPSWWNST